MLNKSLYWKIALAFVLVAFFTAALVAVFIRATSADRLTQLVLDQQRENLQTILANYYQANGSWDGLLKNWQDIAPESLQGGMGMGTGEMGQGNGLHMGMERRSLYGLADAKGHVIVPVGEFDAIGHVLTRREVSAGTAIMVDGERVGVLLTTRSLPVYNAAETLFLQRTNRALILAMFGALLVALLIGLVLARNLTRPLQALTVAARKIAGGQLDQHVEVTSDDEIGELSTAFNQMSREVARVNQQRRQMTADIAHDLRTPLTVISGYVESMRDGVLQPTTQRLDLIYTEIGRLQHLVTDLRMLSQADAGELALEPVAIDPAAALDHTAEVFQHHASQKGVALRVEVESALPVVRVDEARFMQVMDNLISNALRYTPEGGVITLGARQQKNGIEFSVSDTGSGIEPDALPLIFDRFQRGDQSRHADGNESGLGLAIVKALVEAHGGKVSAESIVGRGTTIRLWFPNQI
ncbi:MAG: sensor histidine kinase [Bellilinea sp.]